MKKLYLSLFCLSNIFLAQAQVYNWSADFYAEATKTCPFDSSVSYLNSENWFAYQTLNDEWDGPIDSSQCIPVTRRSSWNNDGVIGFGTYDITKRVFLKYELDTVDLRLFSNTLYEASAFNVSNIDLSDSSCGGEPCNTLHVEIEIPDSGGNGKAYRLYKGKMDAMGYSISTACLPIEKFDTNRVSNFVISIKPKYPTTTDVFISPVTIRDSYDTQNLDSASLPKYRLLNQSEYHFNYGAHFVLHESSDYPDANGMHYHDLSPSVNTPLVDTVLIQISSYASLVFQPFTQFRGDTVVGDTLRHHLVTQMLGGDFCFPPYVDIAVFPGDELKYRAGHISFGNERSCMMFQKGSKLTLLDSSVFHYGNAGTGIMALIPGVDIDFKKGSHLYFDGRMVIDPAGIEADTIFIRLDESETIEFTANARISSNVGSKVIIQNYGGEVLLDALDEQSKRWIEVVEPENNNVDRNSIQLIQNPVEDIIFIQSNLETDVVGELHLYNLNGAEAMGQSISFESDNQQYSIPTTGLKSGMYILSIEAGSTSYVAKLIKL